MWMLLLTLETNKMFSKFNISVRFPILNADFGFLYGSFIYH